MSGASHADRIPDGDWRYLLPSPPQGSVLRVDNSTRSTRIGPSRQFDLVVVMHPAPPWSLTRSGLRTVAERVRVGGTLYLEVSGRRRTPARLKRRLADLGFADAACYWARPSFREADLWLPLGERAIYRYYLRELFFASSLRRKLLRLLLQAAASTAMFERLLPGFAVVATRTGGTRAARP